MGQLRPHHSLLPRLHRIVSGIGDARLTAEDESFLIAAAHAMAQELVLLKLSRSPYLSVYFGLTSRDIAYDAIAELFARDDNGSLIHLVTYFSGFNIETLSAEEVVYNFRRLIGSAVNQHFFGLYKDFDPALGKIIRNIKLAVTAHQLFVEVERFDETCLAPVDCERLEHLPSIDQLRLTELLIPHVRGNEFIPELLSLLSKTVRAQSDWMRTIPLVTIALTFRNLYTLKSSRPGQSTAIDTSLEEMKEVVRAAVKNVRIMIEGRYRGRRAIPSAILQGYFSAIEDILIAKIDGTDHIESSLSTAFRDRMKQVNEKVYRSTHRTRLEYFYKLCREAIAQELVQKR